MSKAHTNYLLPPSKGDLYSPIRNATDMEGNPVALTRLQAGITAVVDNFSAPRSGAGAEAIAEILIRLGWPVDVMEVREAIGDMVKRRLMRVNPKMADKPLGFDTNIN